MVGRSADRVVRQEETAHQGEGEQHVNAALKVIADAVRRQVGVLARIPEKMDPSLYYEKFRPYIRFFENVVYEGVPDVPIHHRGETGAQSSIMPLLIAFMKIDHKPSKLTDHLADMRNFMPAEHRSVIAESKRAPRLYSSPMFGARKPSE